MNLRSILLLTLSASIAASDPSASSSNADEVLSSSFSLSSDSFESDCVVTLSGLSLADALDSGCKDIYIENGNFLIESTIKITRPVRIRGGSARNTILNYTGTGSLLIVEETHHVEVERLTLDVYSHETDANNIWEAFGVFESHHCALRDCIVVGNKIQFAVFFAGPKVNASQPTIDAFESGQLDHNNIVERNNIRQYDVVDVLSFSLQKNGIVRDNIVEGGVISFFMNKDSKCVGNRVVNSLAQGIFVSVPAERNVIKDNEILNSTNAGIKIARQIDHNDDNGESLTPLEYRAPGIVIEGNEINTTGYFGIELTHTIGAKVESNAVQNVALSGREEAHGPHHIGVALQHT